MQYAAVNINYDSLTQAYGFPSDFHDETYFRVADRFLSLAEKYGFKYSIYVIGKDLERQENQQAVKNWAQAGHEIGNHSWSHRLDLGTLPLETIRHEVNHAHQLLTEVVGYPPQGFIAPGWSTSDNLLKALIEAGYTYDTSTFPSWLMYLSMLKMVMNNFGSGRGGQIVNRGDLSAILRSPRQVYYSTGQVVPTQPNPAEKGLHVLPLPTTQRRVACWHTIGFIFGWKFHESVLKHCLNNIQSFYYLIHPLDLMDERDLDPRFKIYEERVAVPLEEKAYRLERALEMILASGRKIVTMQELLAHHLAAPAE